MTPSIYGTADNEVSLPNRDSSIPIGLGPALWMLGALAWAFTVAGDFTTAGFIGEALALCAVIVLTVTAGVLGIRHQLASMPLGHRRLSSTIAKSLGMFVLLLAVLVFPLAVLRTNSDIGMTLLLLLIGICATWLGRRWSGLPEPPPRATLRLPLLALSAILSIVTVVHVLAVN